MSETFKPTEADLRVALAVVDGYRTRVGELAAENLRALSAARTEPEQNHMVSELVRCGQSIEKLEQELIARADTIARELLAFAPQTLTAPTPTTL